MKPGTSSGPFRFPLLAVLSLAVVLAGCGGGGEDAVPDSPGGAEGAEAADPLASLRAPDPDKIVATVNGAEVRAGKVYEVAALNLMSLQAQGRSLDEAQERNLRMAILELIINDELMAQQAEKLGLEVDPAEVDDMVQQIQDQHGTEAAFRQVLTDAGLTEDEFRAEVARRLLSRRYVAELTRDVTVDEAEAKAVYDQMPDRFSEGETVEVRQVLLRATPSDPEAKHRAARERAEEAHARAVAGEDFAELAREYSQAPNAPDGGLVSHFPRDTMVPKFEEVAFGLEVGEISDVFQIPHGYTFILKTDHKPAAPIPFAEVKPQLMNDLAKAKESMIVQAKLAELQSESEVDVFDPEFLPPEPDAEGAESTDAGDEGGHPPTS